MSTALILRLQVMDPIILSRDFPSSSFGRVFYLLHGSYYTQACTFNFQEGDSPRWAAHCCFGLHFTQRRNSCRSVISLPGA